jgi:hypothetical protein
VCAPSHYPLSRTGKDADGRLYGVCGSVELLNSRILSTQPIVSMDWRFVCARMAYVLLCQADSLVLRLCPDSPDREGLCVLASLDQTVRVYIVTKTNKY